MTKDRCLPKRLRIDIVTRFSPLTTGGIQKLVLDIAAATSATCDVRVLAARLGGGIEWPNRLDRVPEWPDEREPRTGVPIVFHGLSPGWRVALAPIVYSPNRYIPHPAWQRYTSFLDKAYGPLGGCALARYHSSTDVVHRFGGSKIALATVRAAHRKRVPVVINPAAHRGQWDDDPLSAKAYREAELVVAESADARQLYLDLGVPEERLVDSPHTAAAPPAGAGAELRRKRALDGEIVLFVGSSFEYKGGGLLVDVADRLERRRPSTRFVLIGGGHEGRGLSNVLLPGMVSEDEKLAWIDAASVVVLPSANESYGLVIDEAWAAGKAVVTSDIPELAGRLATAQAGVSVPRTVDALESAIVDLLDDPGKREGLGHAGKRWWTDHLSPDAYAKWWLEVYHALAERRQPSMDG